MRLEAPRQGLHERRLSGAIGADDADAVAVLHTDGHLIEDRAGAEVDVKRLSAKKVSHPSRVVACAASGDAA
ncbi:hypothetical protein Dac01nite_15140 [Demequina activiva]|uniref:Uncharacterized protein n=1 Tax=Demequina activiva TaxID=1582364 RepID=A0A919UGE8_9MICO|nr:hypothetical protein Dac01nite_15140 [Demequina activiva]